MDVRTRHTIFVKEKIREFLKMEYTGSFSFLALSYNRPYLCPNATWNPNATTFSSSNLTGIQPRKVFVNTNNTVYVANRPMGRIIVWSEGTSVPTRNISGLSAPWSLFVTAFGDIYVNSNANLSDRINKITANSPSNVSVMYTCGRCFDIFIDINNNLYCSMNLNNQVVMKSLNFDSNAVTVVAGTGSAGSASNTLNYPNGIFIDINVDLYVADYSNNRIQMFPAGQLNAITVAGNGLPNSTIILSGPTAVTLDANGYLFISDHLHHRIVRSGVNGLECMVGCSGTNGSQSDQLTNPMSLSFDSYGNLFVADYWNNRIQKFLLMTNSCGKYERNQLPKPRLCRGIFCQIE